MLQKNRFFKFFPPPSFLTMPAVGLDISDRSIHIAELVRNKDILVLGRYGNEKIPEGLISEGVIKDPEEFKKVLIEIQKKYNLTFVRVSLPEQKGYLVKMKVPQMKKSEIRGSLELQLEEYVPISPENAVFDYTIVECGRGDSSEEINVGVAVMPRNVVSQYIEVFKGTGLVPLSFELEAHAITRAIIPEGDCDTLMIVDIGATRTGFSIVSEGIVRFTSTVNIGGNLFTEAVMKAFDLKREDALKKKEKEGLAQHKGKDKSMYATLIPVASILYDEINKRLIYWDTQRLSSDGSKEKKIEKIILCGGEVSIPGLKYYLEANLTTPVEIANPWINITSFDDYIPEIPYRESLRFVTALGLSLRSHI